MLGWKIYVARQKTDGMSPARARDQLGELLAVWQAKTRGLVWLDDLVERDKAIALGGNGYPNWYTALAGHVIPIIQAGPPLANKYWMHGEGDALIGTGPGTTRIVDSEIAQSRPDEWLIVEAWDES